MNLSARSDLPSLAGLGARFGRAGAGRVAWRVRWLLSAALACVALLSAGASGASGAGELSTRDARAVRSTVESQLKAFAADDAERAFSFATPAIRSQFGNAARFMAMVRGSYPMVVRPAATAFFQPETVEGAVLQRVQLRDREGRSWVATYQLVPQDDKSWRINGCVVAADTGKSSV